MEAENGIVFVPCIASGAVVPVHAAEEPTATLAIPSIAAITHLRNSENANWAKAVGVDLAGRDRQWITFDDRTADKYTSIGDRELNHGMILSVDTARVSDVNTEDMEVFVEGEIQSVIDNGHEDCLVRRQKLENPTVMQMYNKIKNDITAGGE